MWDNVLTLVFPNVHPLLGSSVLCPLMVNIYKYFVISHWSWFSKYLRLLWMAGYLSLMRLWWFNSCLASGSCSWAKIGNIVWTFQAFVKLKTLVKTGIGDRTISHQIRLQSINKYSLRRVDQCHKNNGKRAFLVSVHKKRQYSKDRLPPHALSWGYLFCKSVTPALEKI